MEHISINGEKYVKASSIARELGYTSDYVGQLCRGGKVDAQLVGRSWFVSESSIRAHKNNRYRSTITKSKKALKEALHGHSDKQNRDLETPASKETRPPRPNYESDYYDLIPQIPERDLANPSISTQSEDVVTEEVNNSKIEENEAPAAVKTADTDESPSDSSQNIPIRVINKPIYREKRQVKQHGIISEPLETPEETKKIVTDPSKGTITTLFFVFVVLIGMVVFVGLEAHIVSQEGSMSGTYRFDLSPAVDEVKTLKNRAMSDNLF